MANRGKIIIDILELVDSSPCNDMSIKPIIEKHTEGLETYEAQRARGVIEGVLTDLKDEKEIDYNYMQPSFTSTTGGQFNISSFIIRSTHKRFKEQQKIKNEESPTSHKVHIKAGRDVKIDQSFLQDSLSINLPTKEPTKPQKNIIKIIWNWLMTNPIITGIIAGTIATILGAIILKYFHII